VHPEEANPLKLGPHLGDFTDEYPRHRILEYCSAGAKQYALQLQRNNEPDADLEHVIKLRGITLNWDVTVNQQLHYETFKEKLFQFVNGQCAPLNLNYPNFLRPSVRKGSVFTQPLKKMYRPFVGKGIVRPSDFTVLDFGFN